MKARTLRSERRASSAPISPSDAPVGEAMSIAASSDAAANVAASTVVTSGPEICVRGPAASARDPNH